MVLCHNYKSHKVFDILWSTINMLTKHGMARFQTYKEIWHQLEVNASVIAVAPQLSTASWTLHNLEYPASNRNANNVKHSTLRMNKYWSRPKMTLSMILGNNKKLGGNKEILKIRMINKRNTKSYISYQKAFTVSTGKSSSKVTAWKCQA